MDDYDDKFFDERKHEEFWIKCYGTATVKCEVKVEADSYEEACKLALQMANDGDLEMTDFEFEFDEAN